MNFSLKLFFFILKINYTKRYFKFEILMKMMHKNLSDNVCVYSFVVYALFNFILLK